MISIARTFGAPLTVPAGNVARRTSTALRPGASSPETWRREVHHVGVTLQGHQFIHLLGAEGDHPADVVAGEVHEHHVLGPLLRVLAQLGGQAAVVLLAPAAEPGPRDRPADRPGRR